MSQKIFVNGPTNVVRLSGKVRQIEKCIYVFFDFHIDAEKQTKCEDVRSEDVAKFIIDSFDKSNPKMMYDFFFERGPLRPLLRNKKLKGRYLDQISELFVKSFNISTEKKSSTVPNVRFHYADIRDYVIDIFAFYDILMDHQLHDQYNLDNFMRVRNNIMDVSSKIFALQKIIYENHTENPKIDEIFFSAYKDIRQDIPKKYFDDQTKKIIYKIRDSYQNNNIKIIINKIIDTELKNIFDHFLSITNQCLEKLDKLINEHKNFNGLLHDDILLQQEDGRYNYGFSSTYIETVVLQIVTDIDLLYATLSDIGVMLMDLYLLRQFLDKKYITNALSYTGIYHSQNYILFLVKYFGFKITHYSYLKDDDIETAHEKIRKAQTFYDLFILFCPIVFLQCSDMTNFPLLFT